MHADAAGVRRLMETPAFITFRGGATAESPFAGRVSKPETLQASRNSKRARKESRRTLCAARPTRPQLPQIDLDTDSFVLYRGPALANLEPGNWSANDFPAAFRGFAPRVMNSCLPLFVSVET